MGINLQEVSFSYVPHRNKTKNIYALKDASVSIDTKGEFICVVGHTGSGKSTLIQLLNTLLIPTEGNVVIDGKVINRKKCKNLKEIKKNIGLVFQFAEYQLFEETVIKDVEFGPKNFKVKDYHEEAKKACRLVGLDESFYEKSPFKLSGGEMRKVAIAGILASNPDVLILDEPTVGLDPFTRSELLNLLKEINENGKTVIIVTHDMNVVGQMAKRVIIIDDNEIVFDDTKDNFFKNEKAINEHHLDLPDTVKILKELNSKLSLNLDIYKYTEVDAYNEIKKVMTNE